MKYARILLAVASEIWAMHPDKLLALIDFLAMQAAGEKLSAEEIEARIAPQTAAAVAKQSGSVAILPLRGIIANRINMLGAISGGTSAEGFGQSIDQMAADDEVKAIIMDVDSPGGAAQGMDELSAKIAGLRGKKPIIAHVNGTCASAAYWIASAADEIVLSPSAWVGSIGAMTAHEDISAALEKAGIRKTVIASSPFKGENASHLPLSDDARGYMQSLVDQMGAMFEDRIASNRSIDRDLVRSNYGQGRMVLAKQAVAQGMADRIATLEETIARFGGGRGQAPKKFAAERQKRALSL
jgi:signal peptide peptidase SppA